MSKLFEKEPFIKFTKSEWENLPSHEKIINNFYCPDDYPYLCTINSKSFGLCKKNYYECDDIFSKSKIPIIMTSNNDGEAFGYFTNNLHKRCNNLYKDYEYISNTNNKLPEKFKILTYNIWGLIRKSYNKDKAEFLMKILEIRMNAISEEIKKNNPDIICFQEMSNPAYSLLNKNLGSIYKYQYELNFDHESVSEKRNRNVEVYMFSKFPVNKINIYGLEGNQHYNDSFLVAEFDNIVIFNCYLQSGSKYSPGQENYWYHYTRCRIDQLIKIKELMKNYDKTIILLGDFNFHLDGPFEEWAEIKEIKEFQDSWKILNPDKDGFTENTDINHMRWNLKFQEKKLRYDGILFKNNKTFLKPNFAQLIGIDPIILDQNMSQLFEKYFTPCNKEKIKYYFDKLIAIHPSDHFGLLVEFRIIQ